MGVAVGTSLSHEVKEIGRGFVSASALFVQQIYDANTATGINVRLRRYFNEWGQIKP